MIQPVLAAALLLAQAAPGNPCLTRSEAAEVMAATVPSLLDAIARKCGPALPADAFLRTGSGAMLQRLRAETAGRSAASGQAIAKVFGSDMPKGVRPETMVQLFGEGMAGELAADVKEKDCLAADRMIGAMAPLPALNIGTFIATFFEIGTKGGHGDAPFLICEGSR